MPSQLQLHLINVIVQWHRVSLDTNLRQFLPGKIVVEFPELAVLLATELPAYDVIQPDGAADPAATQ